MLYFILGIIVGLFFSLIALITGKKLEKSINDSKHTIKPLINSFQAPEQATIIKRGDDIEDFLNQQWI